MKKIKSIFNKIKLYFVNTIKPYILANRVLSVLILCCFISVCFNYYFLSSIYKLKADVKNLNSEISDNHLKIRELEYDVERALKYSKEAFETAHEAYSVAEQASNHARSASWEAQRAAFETQSAADTIEREVHRARWGW